MVLLSLQTCHTRVVAQHDCFNERGVGYIYKCLFGKRVACNQQKRTVASYVCVKNPTFNTNKILLYVFFALQFLLYIIYY